jgi:tRNA nucleotidyltransferase (CCA-adding enzyme)
VAGELRGILVGRGRPSRAFRFLERVDRLDVLPPVEALRGVPQDPRWHPEGDVFVHTLMVVDRAAELARDLVPVAREVLMWAALCHDLGKPETTTIEGDRVRAIRHEVAGARIAKQWLGALRLATRLIRSVELLVRHHLAPVQFVSSGARAGAYRRLARKLAAADLTPVDLERLARADQLGRTTEEARQGRFEAGRTFLAAARAAGVESGPPADVVRAADLIARGVPAGPALGRALERCRALQDERGWTSAEPILKQLERERLDVEDERSRLPGERKARE